MGDDTRYLKYAALLYALGLALHAVDHLRRGLDVLTPEVQWAGNLSTLLGIAAVVLVLMGHRWAPMVAVVTGIPVALGVAAVHLIPHWSAFSDAFPGAQHTGVTALSYSVVLIEIGGALAMGAAGLALVLNRHRVAPRRYPSAQRRAR
jgi:hypothetical protein